LPCSCVEHERLVHYSTLCIWFYHLSKTLKLTEFILNFAQTGVGRYLATPSTRCGPWVADMRCGPHVQLCLVRMRVLYWKNKFMLAVSYILHVLNCPLEYYCQYLVWRQNRERRVGCSQVLILNVRRPVFCERLLSCAWGRFFSRCGREFERIWRRQNQCALTTMENHIQKRRIGFFASECFVHDGPSTWFFRCALPGLAGFYVDANDSDLGASSSTARLNQKVPNLRLRQIHKHPGVCFVLGGQSLDEHYVQRSQYGGCHKVVREKRRARKSSLW
jgi:hypothetical protein